MSSRRGFVRYLVMSAAGGFALAPTAKLLGQIAVGSDGSLFNESSRILDSAYFHPFVDTDFEINSENLKKPQALKLLEVKDLNRKSMNLRGKEEHCFSLLFRSQDSARLESRIYELSHPALGQFELFLSPVTDDPALLEAIVIR